MRSATFCFSSSRDEDAPAELAVARIGEGEIRLRSRARRPTPPARRWRRRGFPPSPWRAACRISACRQSPCASARGTSSRKPPPWPAGASVIRKSTMILPCGVSSAPKRPSPGRDQRDVGGDKAVEEVARILAAHLDDAAVGQKRCFHGSELFSSSLGKGDAPDIPCEAKALRCPNKARTIVMTGCRGPMNQRFDTILKSGTVVNQDGEGVCDIGITRGPDRRHRRARPGIGRRSHRLQGAAYPARRDGHAGAFPRARADAQGRSRDRLAQRRDGRRHRRVRDAEHQSADGHRGGVHRQDQGAAGIACIAISPSSSAAPARM